MPNIRVLAVDDDPLIREILEGLLVDTYELTLAASGEEALEVAERLRPDVVLMDVMMPGIDGHEACRRMREMECLRATKIILVSGNPPPAEDPGGSGFGADDYLTKPIDFGVLFEKIDKAAGAGQG